MNNLHEYCGEACIKDHKYKAQGIQLFGRMTPNESDAELILFGCPHCMSTIWIEKSENYPDVFCASRKCRDSIGVTKK
jgi:hypothetical protein